MSWFKNLLKKTSQVVWHYDIPSVGKFLAYKDAKLFDVASVAEHCGFLTDPNDEICIEIPTEKKYWIKVSIWGVDSINCTIERVEPKKCSSYLLTTSKIEVKKLLHDIKGLAESPNEYGLIMKKWE